MKNILAPLIIIALFFTSCLPDEKEKEITYEIPPGFELELLFSPKENNRGSWVSLAEGEDGIFYAGDQHGALYQFRVPAPGGVLDSTQVDTIALEIGHAQGLLWAFNSLYVSVNDRWEDPAGRSLTTTGSGVYRLWDSTGDGLLDQKEILLKLEGDGEHGPHSLVLGPDGEDIYFVAGNHTLIPEQLADNSRLPNNWDEDNLFPPYLDARGHANEIEAPGGWIARFKPDGTDWELISAGFRNSFDMAFNADGELFVFDSDMEWDIGMPWYRPIRICHVTSGGEFGWRTGSGKWPSYYLDNLPAVANLDQGSPTAVLTTAKLNLPARYRDGLLVFDWSFGTSYFVDLKAEGSSYIGKAEEFFSGTPLPLTDAIAGSDGNLYFATSGRDLSSHFYRLRYTGEASPEGSPTVEAEAKTLRELRQELEAYHRPIGVEAVSPAWKNLNHSDRFIRYAARIALEHQPLETWKNKFQNEKDPNRIIQAGLALARINAIEQAPVIYQQLARLDWDQLGRAQRLDLLRTISMTAIRLGPPEAEQQQVFIELLGPQFPSNDLALDRELSQLLIYLGDESATTKSVQLLVKHTKEKTISHPTLLNAEVTSRSEEYGPLIMEVLENMPPTEALYYATILSHAEKGWSPKDRESYFSWFFDGLSATGGMSFKPFLENIRQKAMTHVPEDQQAHYEELSGIFQPGAALANLPQPEGPGEAYTLPQINRILNKGLRDYRGNFETGKLIYDAALCSSCHRMRGDGANAGPDLTQAYTRFGRGGMTMAVYSPNDAISDQYTFTLIHLKDGKKMAGTVLSEEDESILLAPNPYAPNQTVEIAKSEIVNREPSPVSPMPPGLLNRLNEKEITDLFAYLLSGGNKRHYYYGGKKGR